MEEKLRISIVSYANTVPLVYGLKHFLKIPVELIPDVPAECARKVINGEVDMGLIPVATIPLVPNAQILGRYGIAASGPVKSVKLYSEVPIDQVTRIYLDHDSRTSVALCRILCREWWKIDPEFVPGEKGFEKLIGGTNAGVVIGDRTFIMPTMNYEFDLAHEWKQHTGLPFVFAAWVANKSISSDFIKALDVAQQKGLEHLNEAVAESQSRFPFPLLDYLQRYIQYLLTEDHHNGLNLFLSKLRT
jgi:chorismate dehydratase